MASGRRHRSSVRRRLRAVLALALVILGATFFAVCFRLLFDAVFEHGYRAPDLHAAFSALPPLACVALPCAGGALAGALSHLAGRYGGTQGVGGVMEILVLERRKISIRGTALRAAGSFAAIATGGSVGREGPLIQFGGGLGASIGQAMRFGFAARQTLVAAGTAAGFAAAYNAPFAAMLFVFEIVIGTLRVQLIAPVAVATAVATAISREISGGGPIYGLRAFTLVSHAELVGHALLGVAAGVLGVAFMAVLARTERAFSAVPLPRWGRTAIGGACVGVLAIALPAVTGNGFEAIRMLLDTSPGIAMILVLLVAKALATCASVGSGTPGGVFTPSLFLGAALGAAFGVVAARVVGQDHIGASGGYALVGMAAVVAATTHAPMMAAVLAYELSGDYAIVLPLLLATGTSTLVARALRRDSIYTSELRRAGFVLHDTLIGRELRWTRPAKPDLGAGI